MLSRRRFVGYGLSAALVGVIGMPHLARAAAPFQQPKLPFDQGALAPSISERTVGLHYGKHHAGYYTALNRLVQNTRYAEMSLPQVVAESAKVEADRAIFNNAGQALNHELYWEQFTPGKSKNIPTDVAERIEQDLGGKEKFMEDFLKAASGVFGSGWVWLTKNDGKLAILGTPGGDNPLTKNQTAVMGIDVWEHAYYLDYENRRTDHVRAVIDNLVNWEVVSNRLSA